MSRVNLVTVAIMVALGLVVYVVIVGGIVCIAQDDYTFAAYLNDLHKILKLMFAVLAVALLQAFVHSFERRRNGESVMTRTAWGADSPNQRTKEGEPDGTDEK